MTFWFRVRVTEYPEGRPVPAGGSIGTAPRPVPDDGWIGPGEPQRKNTRSSSKRWPSSRSIGDNVLAQGGKNIDV